MKGAQCAELPAHTPQGWLKRHHLEETVETSQLCCPHTTSTLVVLLPLQPQPPRRPGFIDHDSCEVDPVSLFFLQVCLLSIVERDPVEDCSTDLVNRIRASAFQGRVTGSKKRPGYIEASKQCMCNSTIPRFGNTDDGLAAKANTNWPTRVDERDFWAENPSKDETSSYYQLFRLRNTVPTTQPASAWASSHQPGFGTSGRGLSSPLRRHGAITGPILTQHGRGSPGNG